MGVPLSNGSMLRVLDRMGRGALTVHGFRATFKTWAGECTNFGTEVIEACLAHVVSDQVIAAYHEIVMVRKRREEKVQRLRRRDGHDLNVLGRKSARWARDNLETLRAATPETPSGLSDRAADAWEPLFAIADLAGGDWPLRARQAALALSGEAAKEDGNIATQLFMDIQMVFTTDQIKSQTLVERLVALEGHPWAEFGHNGKPITQNKLARLLKPYKIGPETIRLGPGEKDTAKGYKLVRFSDVFSRYLPDRFNQTVTPSQPNETGGFCESQTVTPSSDVTDEKAQKPAIPAFVTV